MKMLAMRRENDQMFGSTTSNAINNNTISATNDTVTDNCCSSSSYQEGKLLLHFNEYRLKISFIWSERHALLLLKLNKHSHTHKHMQLKIPDLITPLIRQV